MTNRTATPARPAARAQSARRGGPSGRLVVGEYVGQPAAEAAQAVRRAGLKPGLDRSFGCEAELLGLVVAQEPVAGEDLTRNGMVTLYVAAHGNAPLEEDTNTPSLENVDPAAIATAPLQVAVPKADTSPAPLRPRRPRKPGLARRGPQIFDTPPAPVPVGRGPAGEADAPAADDELSHEEFVVQADDVFAGRDSRGLPAWRRVYPRKRTVGALGGCGVRARLARHPLLVCSAAGMLAVWAVVGVVVALANHPAPTHIAPALTTRAEAPALRAAIKAPVPKPKDIGPARASASARVDPRAREVPSRPPRVIPARRAVARDARSSIEVAPLPRRAPPAAPASPPPPRVREQAQGGPFSP